MKNDDITYTLIKLRDIIQSINRALEGLLKISDSHKARLEALEERVARLENGAFYSEFK